MFMKTILFIVIFEMLAASQLAQDDYDYIVRDSYANRKPVSETRGKEGKISFIVHFAYTIDNQVHKEDAFIRFVLNQNTGALEEFHTYQPS